MAGTGPEQHFHDVEANLAGDLLQLLVVRDGVDLLKSVFYRPTIHKIACALFALGRILPPHPGPLPHWGEGKKRSRFNALWLLNLAT
jgi:hypothetical protein